MSKLLCETNTTEIYNEIKVLAEAKFPKFIDAFFEHGQWFIQVDDEDKGKYYSVVDTSNGLDFEEL